MSLRVLGCTGNDMCTATEQHVSFCPRASSTLSEFLLARIAEDEADAACEAELIESRPRGMKPAHMAFSPDRVLAEAEAKRRIIGTGEFPTRPMRHLASVYSNHPDYNDAWRA